MKNVLSNYLSNALKCHKTHAQRQSVISARSNRNLYNARSVSVFRVGLTLQILAIDTPLFLQPMRPAAFLAPGP